MWLLVFGPEGDLIERTIGSCGIYQVWLFFLMGLPKYAIALNQMAIIFLAPKVNYVCEPYNKVNVCPCSHPQWDTSVFKNTIIMKWKLICSKESLPNLSQTVFQGGTLLGSLLFGMASDKFGRRNATLSAVLIQLIAGIAAVYAPNFWVFTLIRLFLGMGAGALMVTTFTILMEYFGKSHRDFGVLFPAQFNIGHMLLAGVGYYFRDFIEFQKAICVPSVILLIYFFLCPESARWLVANKRKDAAIKVLTRIAKINGRPTDNISYEVTAAIREVERTQKKKGTIADIFRSPHLRFKLIGCSYNWFTCSFCFYGGAQFMGKLSGNIFKNVFFSATFTLIGTLISFPLVKLLGRKILLIASNATAALSFLILIVIPTGVGSVICATAGIVSAFIIFNITYIHCVELFPTEVRNSALGFCSMMARVGSMSAPLLLTLNAQWMIALGFAIVPLVAFISSCFLPETKHFAMMTTVVEAENFYLNSEKKPINS